VTIGYFWFANRRKHLHKWTIYWAFSFLSFIAFGGILDDPEFLFFEIIFRFAYILAAYFLVAGVYDFFDKEQPSFWDYFLGVSFIANGVGFFIGGGIQLSVGILPFIMKVMAYSAAGRLFFQHSERLRIKIMGFLSFGLAVNTILVLVLFEGGWYFVWQIFNGILVTLMVCFGFGLFINSYENLEYKLKRSEQKYKTLFEAIGSTVAVIKKDGTISVINQQGEQLLGYQRDELEEEKSYFDFVAPHDRNRVQELHQKVMGAKTKGPCSYEFVLIDKQGSYKQVDVTENLVSDTNSSVASIIDITERKEMTE